jgi:hypothetical protein
MTSIGKTALTILKSQAKVSCSNSQYINDMTIISDVYSGMTDTEAERLITSNLASSVSTKVRHGSAKSFSGIGTALLDLVEKKFGSQAVFNQKVNGVRNRGIKNDITVIDYSRKILEAFRNSDSQFLLDCSKIS